MASDEILTGPFGAFTIEGHLGTGGMATVYRASHPQLGTIALKVLHKHLVKKPEILHRFWREMRLSDKLDHPNIVRTRDAGVEGERFYVAMDYVEGVSLYQYEKKNGRLAPAQAIELMKQILDGLHHAHEAGMIHRDLKPENIMLDQGGSARISDFGIAKHLEATVSLTQTGTAMGTPYYMAPEQIRNAKTVGPAADIYAAGILLYEMVTGSVPYYAKDPMEVVHHHIHGVPVAPSALAPDVSREFELVILKAMEKAPEDRFKSARFMKKALQMVEKGERTGIKIKSAVRSEEGGIGVLPTLVVLAVLGLGGFYLVDPVGFESARAQVVATIEGEASPATAPATTAAAPTAPLPRPALPPPLPRDLPRLIESADWERARTAAQLGGKLSEKHAGAWAARIRELVEEGSLEEAERAVSLYRDAFPALPSVPFLAGEVAIARGEEDEAAQQIAEGFRLARKEEVEPLFDRYRDSLKALGEAARKVLVAELREVADLRMEAYAQDEALMLLRQSSKIYETPETHLTIAEIYERQGNSKARWHRKRAAVMREGS